MSKPKTEFVRVLASDWVGLYRNGKLIAEGHSLHEQDVLDGLGAEYSTIDASEEWLDACGYLPKNLSEVEEESKAKRR